MDTNSIRIKLDEAIIRLLAKLEEDEESENVSETIAELERLHKLRVEELKVETEETKAETEVALAVSQDKTGKLNAWLQLAGQLGIAIGGWIMYSIWQNREQIFEMEGTPSSPMFRNLLSNMTPKIKK